MTLKHRTYELLESSHNDDDALGRFCQTFILTLITVNVGAIILETVRPIYSSVPSIFYWFELISVAIFTTEYVLRLWSCTEQSKYSNPLFGRLRFAVTPFAVVDLLAIVPFYLPFVGMNLLFLRSIRLFRFFRVAKLARYSSALRSFGKVLSTKREELVVALLLLSLTLIFSSALMYLAENEAQPEEFSSIPAAMWWAVITLTTVGYGDVYPITTMGKIIGAVVAILGIAVFALPTAILGSGFLEELDRRRRATERCPHCGKSLME